MDSSSTRSIMPFQADSAGGESQVEKGKNPSIGNSPPVVTA
jgi:hypothetical protein